MLAVVLDTCVVFNGLRRDARRTATLSRPRSTDSRIVSHRVRFRRPPHPCGRPTRRVRRAPRRGGDRGSRRRHRHREPTGPSAAPHAARCLSEPPRRLPARPHTHGPGRGDMRTHRDERQTNRTTSIGIRSHQPVVGERSAPSRRSDSAAQRARTTLAVTPQRLSDATAPPR